MKKLCFLLCLFSVSFLQSAFAKIKVAKIFSSHMVLQRDAKVPVWGWAEGKEKVKLSFRGKNYKAKIDKDGKWMVWLPKMQAGGPYEMRIEGKDNSITFDNILIGDVWLCSGQSNMEWLLRNSNNASAEIAGATDSRIRHFKVPLTYSARPETELVGGEWESCSPESAGDFTAVGYFFARDLRKHQDVPIGLLNSTWGGSRVEAWMNAETMGYASQAAATAELENFAEAEKAKRLKALKEKMKIIPEKDEGLSNGIAHWAKSDYDDQYWREMDLPGLWEGKGYEGLDGIVWYRKVIQLTAAEAKQDLQLELGQIDDSD
ncbi:MAG: sialate O-acetylesterase, partial [Bacteroidota bacterium]